MAKEYPRASLKKSIEVAEAIYELGGSCSPEMCAHKLNKKIGGSFRDILSSAGKYGLITSSRGEVAVTELYRHIHLAYSTEERKQLLTEAVFNIPLFQEIYDRFKGMKLPVEMLDRLLIRECAVNQQVASRVGKYFIDAVKTTELLGADLILKSDFETREQEEQPEPINDNDPPPDNITEPSQRSPVPETPIYTNGGGYRVIIQGPDINTEIKIVEPEDMEIVEVTLRKVKRKVVEQVQNED